MRAIKKRKRTKAKVKVSHIDLESILIKLGLFLIVSALVLAVFLFYPLIVKEIQYKVAKTNANVTVLASKDQSAGKAGSNAEIVAFDPEFSIIVPKIGVNSKVISNVDSYSSFIHQRESTKGVIHIERTVYPGEVGNSFYFVYSSDNFYDANRYNSIFYLLVKMKEGDLFYFVYKRTVFKYRVTDVKIVNVNSVDYLTGSADKKLATLMTCWPAGTSLKRLIVVGELVE